MDMSGDGILVDEARHPWDDITGGSYAVSATDSGPWFSGPFDLTQASLTHDSASLSSPNFGLQGQLQQDHAVASSSRLAFEPLSSQDYDQSLSMPDTSEMALSPIEETPAMQQVDAQDSDQTSNSISAEQEAALQIWSAHCSKHGKKLDEGNLQAIAQLTDLSMDFVRNWFRAAAGDDASQPDPLSFIDVEIDENMRQAVEHFAKQRHGRPCGNAQSKKAHSHHKYKCLFGCNYSTHDWDTWRRHLATKFPQAFWICKLCHRAQRAPCIWSRKDKLSDHMRVVHPTIQKPDRTKLCEASQVQYEADFPSMCPFYNYSGPCGFRPSSWEEYIEHCKKHFDMLMSDGPWQLRFHHRPPPKDDDHHDEQSGSGQSSREIRKSINQPLHSKSSRSSATNRGRDGSHHSRSRDDATRAPDYGSSTGEWSESVEDLSLAETLCKERSLGTVDPSIPFSLVDVEQHKMVSGSLGLKYLALDYSRIPRAGWSSDSHLTLFANAIALTRDMGYRYLWIDSLSISNGEIDQEMIYRTALLTIFMIKFDMLTERIWHFTCHYKKFDNVLKWANQGVISMSCSHIRNLGHGAYGIVDEVRLSVEPEPFARKMYLRWKHMDNEGSMPVKELEMLQKLEHENIPKFVAAYVSSNSLNILMLPVAECNLREFLAQPQRWPEKRPHLSTWFHPLASALKYMHNLSCRHKDIKPANILIKGRHVYLSDFGTSSDFSSLDESNSCGGGIMTPKYCAPEVARRGQRGRKADVFSLGCVFLEMITVELNVSLKDLDLHLGLSKSSNRLSTIYSSHIKSLKSWLKALKTRVSTSLHEVVIDLSKRMLNLDPAQRPTAEEVFDTLRGCLTGPIVRQPAMGLTPSWYNRFWVYPEWNLSKEWNISEPLPSTKPTKHEPQTFTCCEIPEITMDKSFVMHIKSPKLASTSGLDAASLTGATDGGKHARLLKPHHCSELTMLADLAAHLMKAESSGSKIIGHAAPETYDICTPYNRRYDVWALGCILLELATFLVGLGADGHPPNSPCLDKMRKILNADWYTYHSSSTGWVDLSWHAEINDIPDTGSLKCMSSLVNEISFKSRSFRSKIQGDLEPGQHQRLKAAFQTVENITLSSRDQFKTSQRQSMWGDPLKLVMIYYRGHGEEVYATNSNIEAPTLYPWRNIPRTKSPRPRHARKRKRYYTNTCSVGASYVKNRLQRLRVAWAEVLGVREEEIRDDDDFADLGGDSLLMIRLSKVARQQGIELSISDIYQWPKLREMAAAARLPYEASENLGYANEPKAVESESDTSQQPLTESAYSTKMSWEFVSLVEAPNDRRLHSKITLGCAIPDLDLKLLKKLQRLGPGSDVVVPRLEHYDADMNTQGKSSITSQLKSFRVRGRMEGRPRRGECRACQATREHKTAYDRPRPDCQHRKQTSTYGQCVGNCLPEEESTALDLALWIDALASLRSAPSYFGDASPKHCQPPRPPQDRYHCPSDPQLYDPRGTQPCPLYEPDLLAHNHTCSPSSHVCKSKGQMLYSFQPQARIAS